MKELAIFTKPWKALDLRQLAEHIQALGFDMIELPVRPGFQVEPETIERDLPAAVKLLGDHGIRVLNVTADTEVGRRALVPRLRRSRCIAHEPRDVLAA